MDAQTKELLERIAVSLEKLVAIQMIVNLDLIVDSDTSSARKHIELTAQPFVNAAAHEISGHRH